MYRQNFARMLQVYTSRLLRYP